MPNRRDLKLDEYDIGPYAYRELHNFCLRYADMRKRLAELRSPYNSPKITETPHGTGIGDQTARSGELAAELSKNCEMIEQAALEAGGKNYPYLLLAVTQDVPWHYLRSVKGLNTYEKGFRKEIHRFYFCLAKKKKII